VPVELSGSIDGGPTQVTDQSSPTATFSARLGLNAGNKTYSAATGVLVRQLASPSSYTTLDGVGSGKTVSKGTFLYVRSVGGPLTLRLTTDDGSGGDVVAVVPIQGPMIIEFPDSNPLKLLEAKGSIGLEYLVTGS